MPPELPSTTVTTRVVAKAHSAHFIIDNAVDRLDLSEVFASYEGTEGRPPYHPR